MRNAPSRSCKEAVVTTTASSRPPVSTAPCRVRPVISFPPSYWLLSVGTVSAARRAHSITAAVGTGPRPIGRTRPPPDTGAGAVDEGGSVVVAVPAEGLHRGRAGGGTAARAGWSDPRWGSRRRPSARISRSASHARRHGVLRGVSCRAAAYDVLRRSPEQTRDPAELIAAGGVGGGAHFALKVHSGRWSWPTGTRMRRGPRRAVSGAARWSSSP